MPHKVTLYIDSRIVAEQMIPSDYLDTSHTRFDVRLDPTEDAIKNDFLRESTYVLVTVEKV